MKVRILGSSPEDTEHRQYLTSFVIKDAVAIDAGGLGLCGTPQEQSSVRHILLTHSHADHTASLPIFIENVYHWSTDSPIVYGSQHALDAVQRHIFNNVMWPDFVDLSTKTAPFLRLQALEAEKSIEIEA